MLMDLPVVVVVLVALAVIVLWLDVLFAGGAMTVGMMHGFAGALGTPHGWLVITALVIVILVAFALLVGQP